MPRTASISTAATLAHLDAWRNFLGHHASSLRKLYFDNRHRVLSYYSPYYGKPRSKEQEYSISAYIRKNGALLEYRRGSATPM